MDSDGILRYENRPVLQSVVSYGQETRIPDHDVCRLSYYLKCCVVGCGIELPTSLLTSLLLPLSPLPDVGGYFGTAGGFMIPPLPVLPPHAQQGVDPASELVSARILDYERAHLLPASWQAVIRRLAFGLFSYEKLLNSCIILDDEHLLLPTGTLNTFFEIKTAATFFTIQNFFTDITSGKQIKVHKVMLCTTGWVLEYYLQPFLHECETNILHMTIPTHLSSVALSQEASLSSSMLLLSRLQQLRDGSSSMSQRTDDAAPDSVLSSARSANRQGHDASQGMLSSSSVAAGQAAAAARPSAMAMGAASASASSSTSNSSNAVYDTSRVSISIPLVRSSIEQFVGLLSQYIESVQANQRLQLQQQQQHQEVDGQVGHHRHHHHLHHDDGQVVAAGLPDGGGLGWREDDDVVHIQPLNEQHRDLLLAHDAHMATIPVVIPDYDEDDDQDETMMHHS